jgi:RNA polymerase sigma-70 factor (ECF subfamily)
MRGPDVTMDERRQLINLAYRLLGSLADAEDVVQETYARWYAMSQAQRDAIDAPGAWMMKVASRICLNLLGSARARRETYVGTWIPEPLPEPGELADQVTLDESVTMAFLVVLEAMTPAERVAFVLHDVFRYPFAEVAEMEGRTPAACRKLASSARQRVDTARPAVTPKARDAAIVREFKRAWQAKDVPALIQLLDRDAVATADSGGRALTFLDPIRGSEQVAQAWAELADRAPEGVRVVERTVNGRPGLVSEQDGRVVTVFAFDVDGDRIKHIWVVRNPDKLRTWTALARSAS